MNWFFETPTYTAECKHQGPPCAECYKKGQVWGPFDPERGSIGKHGHKAPRMPYDVLESIESLLRQILAKIE